MWRYWLFTAGILTFWTILEASIGRPPEIVSHGVLLVTASLAAGASAVVIDIVWAGFARLARRRP